MKTQPIWNLSGSAKANRFPLYGGLILLGLCGLSLAPTGNEAGSGEAETEFAGKVLSITVTGDDVKDGGTLQSFRDLLARAAGAEAIVLRLNTPSDYAAEQAGAVLDALSGVEVPVVAWVKPSALGLGALLVMGSDRIYLDRFGIVGAASPSAGGGKDDDAGRRQAISVLKARSRSLALGKGHRPELAEAFIDPDYELELRDGSGNRIELSPSGEVLTLTAEEAGRDFGGQPLLSADRAGSLEEILEREGFGGEVIAFTPREWRRENERRAMGGDAGKAVAGSASAGTESEEGTDPEGVEVTEEPVGAAPLFGRRDTMEFAGKILVLEVGDDDLLTRARFQFMRRVLEKAREDVPAALILDMNTPGGAAMETSQLITKPFQDLPFPTYTFVNPSAESAGAMIAIATDTIYMYPTSTIGSALLILGTGQDPPEKLGKKLEAMVRAEIRNVAIARGHNPDVAEAFVTTETELVVDGVMISPRGEVLNLNALEATRIYNGKPLLAKGLARSIDEIIAAEGLEGEVLRVAPTGMEAFAEWVQLASALLIAIGLAGAYTELNSPGFGIPGAVAITAFTIFFFGNYAAGNMAGYETAVAFGLGLLLVVLELFILPGTFVIGAIGAMLMVGALGFALVERGVLEDFLEGGDFAPSFGAVFGMPMLSLSLGLLLAMGLILMLMRTLPGLKPMRWMMLQAVVPAGTSLALEDGVPAGETGGESIVGRVGRAVTDLRPSGRARIGDRLLDVSTESDYLEEGTAIRVTGVKGSWITVERA